ncbi:MAG TPA: sugar transferase [Thermodesulfobacteriota bacterium]|nr:sugar transferase [Thermodesulfobacteriota bacterium]
MSRESSANNGRRFYAGYGKRALDLAVSVPALLALSPLLFIVAALVKAGSPGPVFYAQERVGRRGRPFKLYKFRTMVTGADKSGPAVTSSGDARITPLGRTLRKWKLDELPQLWNVVRGDMSLVGPRPEVRKYTDIFRDDYSAILEISPGITDYAALEFRNEEEVLARYPDAEEAYTSVVLPEKIALYRQYLRDMGFRSDMKIIFRTIREVIRC